MQVSLFEFWCLYAFTSHRVCFKKATNGKKQSDYLKREVRDLSDQISDMQDDLQILDVYDTGAFG